MIWGWVETGQHGGLSFEDSESVLILPLEDLMTVYLMSFCELLRNLKALKAVIVSSERFLPLSLMTGRCMTLNDRRSVFYVLLSSPFFSFMYGWKLWSPFAFVVSLEANIWIAISVTWLCQYPRLTQLYP